MLLCIPSTQQGLANSRQNQTELRNKEEARRGDVIAQ